MNKQLTQLQKIIFSCDKFVFLFFYKKTSVISQFSMIKMFLIPKKPLTQLQILPEETYAYICIISADYTQILISLQGGWNQTFKSPFQFKRFYDSLQSSFKKKPKDFYLEISKRPELPPIPFCNDSKVCIWTPCHESEGFQERRKEYSFGISGNTYKSCLISDFNRRIPLPIYSFKAAFHFFSSELPITHLKSLHFSGKIYL